MTFYNDIVDMFNRHSDADNEPRLAYEMDSDGPFGAEDMQAWAESLAVAGGVLGAVYEDAGMVGQGGQYMRGHEPAEPAPPAFDPEECTVLREPMTLRRGRITLGARRAGLFS